MEETIKEYNLHKENIKSRLNDFKKLSEKEKFHELLFCLLTPQSNAKKCWEAVKEISLLNKFSLENIINILKTKTRFHNNKARYIIEAKDKWNKISLLLKNKDIYIPINRITKKRECIDRDSLKKCNTIIGNLCIFELRNELAEEIKGFGLKEASHFLRNIGLSNNKIAILDRHILRNLVNYNIIPETKIKNKKDYFEKEKLFLKFSQEINIPLDEIDLLFWQRETGEIFK